MATAPWINAARETLMAARHAGSGWGYRPETESSVEPSVLASLALLATGDDGRGAESRAAAAATCRWLAQLQNAGGAVGLSATLPGPHWPTALALLLWSVLPGWEESRDRAARWLLARRGKTWEPAPHSPYGHDVRLAGWPWLAGTHSWLEPTAWALLALARCGLGGEKRAAEGAELISDRAVAAGGWNYGNSSVFGTELRAHPEPTGLALLVLASRAAGKGEAIPRSVAPPPDVGRALAYLESALPTIRTGRSLGWGLLGLSAWERRPAAAGEWLAEAYERTARLRTAVETAVLLLASTYRSLRLLAGLNGGEQ